MRLLHQLPPNTYDDDLALTPREGPEAVLGLVAEVTESALAANLYLLHPTDVDLSGGRAVLAPEAVRPERSVSMAPEVLADGPVPATLSYAVAAIAALATLDTLEIAPDDPEGHVVWVQSVRARLRAAWAGLPGAEATVELFERCLAFPPSARPHPKNLLEEIARLRALLGRLPDIEAPPPPPPPPPPPRPGPAVPPLGALRSHPLVPYAMVTVVLAGLALAVALCTFGVVMGRFADALDEARNPAALAPIPSPERAGHPRSALDPSVAPGFPSVATGSPFDRFERAPLTPGPLGGIGEGSAPARTLEAAPVSPAAVPVTSPEPVVEQARPEPVRAKLPSADRPKAAPGSDLRDPWGR